MVFDSNTGVVLHKLTEEGKSVAVEVVSKLRKSMFERLIDIVFGRM